MASEASPWGVALSARSACMAQHTQPGVSSEHVPWHGSRRLTDGQAVQGCRPVLQGIFWHSVVRRVGRGGTTSRSTWHIARGNGARRGTGGGDWTTRGKVSTGRIHGPRRTYLTLSKALDRSEEGRRWRCGAH
jgi:hypothetical protein